METIIALHKEIGTPSFLKHTAVNSSSVHSGSQREVTDPSYVTACLSTYSNYDVHIKTALVATWLWNLPGASFRPGFYHEGIMGILLHTQHRYPPIYFCTCFDEV